MDNLSKLLTQYSESYEKLKNQILKSLKEIAERDEVVIVLEAYYPYFNDGDLCEYSCELYIYRPATEQELKEFEYDLESNDHYSELYLILDTELYMYLDRTERHTKYAELYKLIEYSHILQPITGNNATLIITPHKVEIWDTEPY